MSSSTFLQLLGFLLVLSLPHSALLLGHRVLRHSHLVFLVSSGVTGEHVRRGREELDTCEDGFDTVW